MSLRRRAQDNAPVVSYWLRSILRRAPSCIHGVSGAKLQCTTALFCCTYIRIELASTTCAFSFSNFRKISSKKAIT